MNGCYLDANLLINFKNVDSLQHQQATELIINLTAQSEMLYISPLVIDEFLNPMKYILRNHRDMYARLSQSLNEILVLPKITLVNPPTESQLHMKVVELMEKYNLKPRDAYHLLIMQSNQIDAFATFDTDFDTVFQAGIIRHYKGAAAS